MRQWLFIPLLFFLVGGSFAAQVTIRDAENKWEIVFENEGRWSEWIQTGKRLPPMTAETNFTCFVEDCARAPVVENTTTVIPLNQSASELIEQVCNETGCTFKINIPYVESQVTGGAAGSVEADTIVQMPASLFNEMVRGNLDKLNEKVVDLDICERNRESCEAGYREYRTDTSELLEERDRSLGNCLGTLNILSINSSSAIASAYERGENRGWESSQKLNKYSTYGAIIIITLILLGLGVKYVKSRQMWM